MTRSTIERMSSNSSDVPEHAHEHHRDRLGEVQDVAGVGDDQVRVVEVGVDVVGHALRRWCWSAGRGRGPAPAGRCPRRRSSNRGAMLWATSWVFCIVGRPVPMSRNCRIPSSPASSRHRPDEELPGLLGHRDDARVHRDHRVAGLPVDRVVVLAAHPVVPDPGRLRDVVPDLIGQGRILRGSASGQARTTPFNAQISGS